MNADLAALRLSIAKTEQDDAERAYLSDRSTENKARFAAALNRVETLLDAATDEVFSALVIVHEVKEA